MIQKSASSSNKVIAVINLVAAGKVVDPRKMVVSNRFFYYSNEIL